MMMPQQSVWQLQLDSEPGLTERYATVLECVRACVYSNAKTVKAIAIEMDMSPSDLSRKLASNPEDSRRFSTCDLEHYVMATGDTTPIVYLVQKYCVDARQKRSAAIAALADMVPQIEALLKEGRVQ